MPDSQTLASVTVTSGMVDADLTRALRRVPEVAVYLLLSGDMAGEVAAPSGWMPVLLDTSALPVTVAEADVGLRGLALLLLADIALIGPAARWTGAQAAELTELAALRLGPLAARQLALAADPLDLLVRIGHAERVDSPMAEAPRRCGALSAALAARLRQGARAARELPAGEALTFGGWCAAASAKARA